MSWEWLLQPAVTLLALLGMILLYVLTWVFTWGRRVGKVNTRLRVIEEKLDNPEVHPDCAEIFNEIREKLADLGGKVQAILIFMEGKQSVRKRRAK